MQATLALHSGAGWWR
ncbi:TPA: hypothetical protein RQN05_000067 [Aeromonas dhakensis]|nr:hypothetical protein [Aeromonas dhakensis]HEA3085801.1 hypothetical protein [Aeromonas dhakensis]